MPFVQMLLCAPGAAPCGASRAAWHLGSRLPDKPAVRLGFHLPDLRLPFPLDSGHWTAHPNLVASSISGKYDFPTKITTRVSFSVTSQSNCVAICGVNRIGDPRNLVFQKHSPRLDRAPLRLTDLACQTRTFSASASAVERKWQT